MEQPCYIGLNEARRVLEGMGVSLSERQMKRAAEPDMNGMRKLPFFICPVEGTLKIEKGTLVGIYRELQQDAQHRAKRSVG